MPRVRWADRLPVEERARFPRLCIYHAWALMFEWRLEEVEPALAMAEAHLAAQIAELRLLLSRSRPELDELFVQAVEWADGSGLRPGDTFRYEQEYDYLTLARLRITQGRAEEVLPLLDRLVAAAGGAGRIGQLIAYLALQAVAHHACGRTDVALAALFRALAFGEPEGYVRTFLDLWCFVLRRPSSSPSTIASCGSCASSPPS